MMNGEVLDLDDSDIDDLQDLIESDNNGKTF